jgi:ABC-type antimicrobial peptide transport system permease subunit
MAAVGSVCGLFGTVALGRAAQSLLFDVPKHDPLVLSAAAVTVALVALVAGGLPAYLASRVDPMQALRPDVHSNRPVAPGPSFMASAIWRRGSR